MLEHKNMSGRRMFPLTMRHNKKELLNHLSITITIVRDEILPYDLKEDNDIHTPTKDLHPKRSPPQCSRKEDEHIPYHNDHSHPQKNPCAKHIISYKIAKFLEKPQKL